MMHHPNMHHQAMSGHPPQHMPSHQMPTHHQMPPPQMHRESRMPMGPAQAGGMAHGQMGGMGAMSVHHGPTRPPHAIRPMHHQQQHHSVPQQMKPLRRGYVGGGYGPGAAPGIPLQYTPPQPMQPPPPVTQPPTVAIPPPASVTLATDGDPAATASDAAAAGDAEPPRSPAAAQANSKEKTPMCLVNELARYNKIKHQYRLTSETGPAHKKVFTVTLRLGESEEYTAEGSSIKRAQHAAAHAALNDTGYPAPPPRAPHAAHHAHSAPRHSVMPTVELNALAMKLCQPALYTSVGTVGAVGIPRYPRPRPPYRMPLAFPRPLAPPILYRVRVSVGGRAWLGEGGTPQAARHDAAARALRDLRQAAPAPAPPPPEPSPPGDAVPDNISLEVKSPVSLVHELALKRNLSVIFSVKSERGPPHMRVFITTCTVGDMETEGEGNGKKVSKRRAAERMLDEMRRRWPAAIMRPRLTEPRRHAPTKRKPRNLVKEGTVASAESQSGADNPISRLAVARHALRSRSPQYRVLEERGAARRREFLVQCDAPPHCATGRGPNKKTAKRRAAANVLLAMEMANGTSNGETATSPVTIGESAVNTSAESAKVTPEAKRKIQDDTADLHGVSQPIISKTCEKVAEVLSQMSPRFIKMPATIHKQEQTMRKFRNIAGVPTVIGAIDCTHIKIKKFNTNEGQLFINRKGFSSINVQVVCDADLKIMDIVARWRGSVHDSRIFRESRIKSRFEAGAFSGILLGDSGYPCTPYLFTPILNPSTPPEERYNKCHIRTWNTVERCFGLWKQRFRCLLRGMYGKLETTRKTTVACAILHNIAIDMREDLFPGEEDSMEQSLSQMPISSGILNTLRGNIRRREFIETHFQ